MTTTEPIAQFNLPSNRDPSPAMTIRAIAIGKGYGEQIEADITLDVDGLAWHGTIWIEPDRINGGWSRAFDAHDDFRRLNRWLRDNFDAILFDPNLFDQIVKAKNAT